MLFSYKSLHSNGPAYVKDILNWYAPTRHLRSMNCPTLVPMKCRSIMVHNRLMQSGSSKCWNDLPKAVKCAGSLTLFKKQLKTYFFSLQQYHHYIYYLCICFVCMYMYVFIMYVFTSNNLM